MQFRLPKTFCVTEDDPELLILLPLLLECPDYRACTTMPSFPSAVDYTFSFVLLGKHSTN